MAMASGSRSDSARSHEFSNEGRTKAPPPDSAGDGSLSARKLPARLLQMGMSTPDRPSGPPADSQPRYHQGATPGAARQADKPSPPPAVQSSPFAAKSATSPFASASTPFGASRESDDGPSSGIVSMTHAPSLMAPQLRKMISGVEPAGMSRANSLPNLLLANKLGKASLSAQLNGSRSPAEARLEAHEKAVNERILRSERVSLSGNRLGSMPNLDTPGLDFRQAFLSSLSSLDTSPGALTVRQLLACLCDVCLPQCMRMCSHCIVVACPAGCILSLAMGANALTLANAASTPQMSRTGDICWFIAVQTIDWLGREAQVAWTVHQSL